MECRNRRNGRDRHRPLPPGRTLSANSAPLPDGDRSVVESGNADARRNRVERTQPQCRYRHLHLRLGQSISGRGDRVHHHFLSQRFGASGDSGSHINQRSKSCCFMERAEQEKRHVRRRCLRTGSHLGSGSGGESGSGQRKTRFTFTRIQPE